MKDTLVQAWPDGHALLEDQRHHWVVKHPQACNNAHRGPKGNFAYAKETYFTQEINMEEELRACQVNRSAA